MSQFRHPVWRTDYEEYLYHASYNCVDGVCDVPDSDDAAHTWFLNMGYELLGVPSAEESTSTTAS